MTLPESNSLLLNEEALRQCPDPTKPVFIYEWLRFLDRILPVTQKSDLRNCQQKLLEQLTQRIVTGPGPPTRTLLAKCIAQVFSIADTYDLFQTINTCNDALKAKDDSTTPLAVKLTALAVLGEMYERIGRLVGRSYEESFQLLTRWLKGAESTSRTEILLTLAKMIHGLGSAAYSVHKELYKLLTKGYLTERVMSVRVAAIRCLHALVSESGSPIYANELDSICTVCVKCLDGSNYEVRTEMAKVFAQIAAYASSAKPAPQAGSTKAPATVDDILQFLSTSFLKGGISSFLKTSSSTTPSAQKEIRIGIALAYVEVAHELGPRWLEKSLLLWVKHLLDLAYKCGPLAFTSNASQASEAVHMRKCISYVFRNTIGTLLSEQTQITACKYFGAQLADYINCFDCTTDTDDERLVNADTYSSAQASIVSLLEISALVRQIGTSVTPLFVEASGIMEPVFACLMHPVFGARVAAAWCLRCVTLSVPSQSTPLIDRCINRLEHMKKSSDAISGFSLALSALLAGSRDSELGIPFCKSRQVFTLAEDMIKTATQTCKLALRKIQAGWMLVSAVISMGPQFVKQNANRLFTLWKYSFPRSIDEAKAEKGRGDAFTWECTLESRSGALASMDCFLEQCADLVTDDVLKKVILPVETSLTTMSMVADLLLTFGTKLRNPVYLLRIRLYSLLGKVQLKCYEHLFNSLLRELVADITLSDNAQASTTSSLVADLCSSVEPCLLGGWIKNTSQAPLELEMHPTQTVVTGCMENDPMCVIYGSVREEGWPEPFPVHVASIDAALLTFGRVYPVVASKHKLQLTNHYLNCFKNLKQGPRLHAVHLNVLGAVLCAMKGMGEQRHLRIEGEELQRSSVNLVIPFLNSDRITLKCLAVETLGRMAQAVCEPQFVAGNAQFCFDKLRTIRDEKSRTGFGLSLGCLHRYMGTLGSGQHLNTSVSIILALAQDNASPTVQAWAILSLSLIAMTGGGMFRGYVEPSLSLCLRLLITTASSNVEIILSICKLVSALITAVGPELPTTVGTIEHTRTSFIIACSMMFSHPDPQIKAEAIACLQQLHLFAPRFVQLDKLVTDICHLLYSPHLVLRKAAICCLRQLLQREAKEVREHAQNLVPAGLMDKEKNKESPLPETGIEGALFELLDTETDDQMRTYIKESLMFLVQATSGDYLNFWLTMCKDILASSSETARSTIWVDDNNKPAVAERTTGGAGDKDIGESEDAADDEDTLQVNPLGESKTREKVTPRWPTRVFAFEIVQKLMTICETERAHLDLALAKELQTASGGRADYLVLHLSDLVRMSFMGATSDNSNLRLAGLSCLQDVIRRFSNVPEPEFPGHVILEQFQAQVGAALRPAFVPETPSHVTAAACQVCSTWITSGVARDLNDLRRVHQLLVSSLAKLKHGSMNTQLYNESAATLEKLAILKAWAEVYIVAVQQEQAKSTDDKTEPEENEYGSHSESLLKLVNPELHELIGHWFALLRDSALLSLPTEFSCQLPSEGGAFYTPDSAESCKNYYRVSWPPILLATSIWLNHNNFDVDFTSIELSDKWPDNRRETRFHLMLGMCVETLCSSRQQTESDKSIQLCLETMKNLAGCEWAQLELMRDVRVPIEILNVLHRLILTRDNLQTQKCCAEVVASILDAAEAAMKHVDYEDVTNGNVNAERVAYKGYNGKENVEDAFDPRRSLTFATLEVCLCLLVRQIPQINSAIMKSRSASAPLHFRKYSRLPLESCELICSTIHLLVKVPTLCNDDGAVVVLPTVLYLVLGVIREASRIDNDQGVPDSPPGHVTMAAAAAMMALRKLVAEIPDSETFDAWESVIRSALLSLLNMTEGEVKVDNAVVMLAVTVIVTTAPSNLTVGKPLFHRICRLYKACLSSENVQVQQKALQSITSVFARCEARSAYVKELGSAVFDMIRPFVLAEDETKKETDLPMLENLSDAELAIIQDTIKAIETVLENVKPEKEFPFVNLLVRSLTRFLCPDPAKQLRSCHPNVRRLHDFALQRLNVLGPRHPTAFRTMIQSCPAIKQRVEIAAQALSSTQQAQAAATAQQKRVAATSATPQQPAIKLRMDFGGFTTPSS